jgi:hypothetical protein
VQRVAGGMYKIMWYSVVYVTGEEDFSVEISTGITVVMDK